MGGITSTRFMLTIGLGLPLNAALCASTVRRYGWHELAETIQDELTDSGTVGTVVKRPKVLGTRPQLTENLRDPARMRLSGLQPPSSSSWKPRLSQLPVRRHFILPRALGWPWPPPAAGRGFPAKPAGITQAATAIDAWHGDTHTHTQLRRQAPCMDCWRVTRLPHDSK